MNVRIWRREKGWFSWTKDIEISNPCYNDYGIIIVLTSSHRSWYLFGTLLCVALWKEHRSLSFNFIKDALELQSEARP